MKRLFPGLVLVCFLGLFAGSGASAQTNTTRPTAGTSNSISIAPQKGDNWDYIQKTINWCIANNVKTIYFAKGEYPISKPLVCENNGKFFSLNLIGEDAAHFNLETAEPRIICNFKSGYAIAYQLCRSSLIKGLVIYGQGIQPDERFKPYAGIVVDPVYRGTTSGSSGLIIRDCRIRNFTAGIVISPNGTSLNAENIHVENCSVDHVKIAYATCQRQSKANTVKNLICWENIETVFDGKTYGQGLGVIPYIYGVNVAGYVKQVFNFGPQLFATSATAIFAETLERIGSIEDGACGVTIRDSHFDFDLNAFPEYHFKGNRVKFDNCSMRYYDDKNDKRIVIDGIDNLFYNGYADIPFLMQNSGKEELGRTNRYFNYQCVPESLDRVVKASELETYQWLDKQYINVEKKYIEVTDQKFNVKFGDYIVTLLPFKPIARVVGRSGNKILIDNITQGVKTGNYHVGVNGFKSTKSKEFK